MQKTCSKGHVFYKSSSCPVCPICEEEQKPSGGLLSVLAAPARRAVVSIGISTVQDLSKHTKKELLALHGFGPASIPTLTKALKEAGLDWKEETV